MFNRNKFFTSYLRQFAKEYEKSLEGFSVEEQIHITDTLLAVLECYRQNPPDYKKAEQTHEELFKKYGKRLTNYSNIRLTSYFTEQSTKHLDLQFDLKVDEAGIEENFFTPEEQRHFFNRAEILLQTHKRIFYLQKEPLEKATEENQLGKTEKTKWRPKRQAEDNLTLLNQEQTVLLIHYLQREKFILPEGYLNNKQAGDAFSILTGYSADTLRQSLGEAELKRIKHKKNLTDLSHAITHLDILIKREIRESK